MNFGWMDGWTDGRTDGRTDGWMDTHIMMPNDMFILGDTKASKSGKKSPLVILQHNCTEQK